MQRKKRMERSCSAVAGGEILSYADGTSGLLEREDGAGRM